MTNQTLILVAQGAEYQAVIKAAPPQSQILAIPIGVDSKFLAQIPHLDQYRQILVMGLCGSLSPQLQIGDVVVYGSCFDLVSRQKLPCQYFPPTLKPTTKLVSALTSDRLIYLATEKQNLYPQAEVVDMEGYGILAFFQDLAIPVGMMRVVSDDCHHDLPNLEAAIDGRGNLQPLPMAIAFWQKPRAALRLIQGSLRALHVLSNVKF